jgi:hypothetical protein
LNLKRDILVSSLCFQMRLVPLRRGVKFRVLVETDAEADLILHWGVAEASNPDTWIMPPANIMPRGTKALAEVCQTSLIKVRASIDRQTDERQHSALFLARCVIILPTA